MKYEALVQAFRDQPFFDLGSALTLFSNEDPGSLKSSLHRFMKGGRLESLRRGMYAFPDQYRRAPIHPPFLARHIYAPSYLSERWALSFYGVIPEMAALLSSVSTRVTRAFSNSFGEYRYRTIKGSAFFGYEELEISGLPVLLARPEKALLDLWHLEGGEWPLERMESFRFDPRPISQDTLAAFAERFDSARIMRAVDAWDAYIRYESAGEGAI